MKHAVYTVSQPQVILIGVDVHIAGALIGGVGQELVDRRHHRMSGIVLGSVGLGLRRLSFDMRILSVAETVCSGDERPKPLAIAQHRVDLASGELPNLIHRLKVQRIVHRQCENVVNEEQRKHVVALRHCPRHKAGVRKARLVLSQINKRGFANARFGQSDIVAADGLGENQRIDQVHLSLDAAAARSLQLDAVDPPLLQEHPFEKDILIRHQVLPNVASSQGSQHSSAWLIVRCDPRYLDRRFRDR